MEPSQADNAHSAASLGNEAGVAPGNGARVHAGWILFGLLLFTFAVKAALVLSLADVFFYGEELEKGTAAKGILDSLPVPHYQLAYHYYEGGGIAISHLTALVFAVLGENLLAHKLVSLLFNFGILSAGFLLVQKHFGRLAAFLFGLLFALAPVGFQKISLLNLGIHYESSLFLLATFALGLAVLRDRALAPKRALALGSIAGLGIFFGYQNLPAVGFLGLLLIWRLPAFWRQCAPLCIAGLVGLLPLFAMWTFAGSAIFDIHGSPLIGGEESSASFASKLDNVRLTLDSLFADKNGLECAALCARLALPFVAVLLFWKQRKGSSAALATKALAGYMLFFGVIYLFSSFQVGAVKHHFLLQRFTPFWCLGSVLAAAALAKGIGLGGFARVLGVALSSLLLLDGALGLKECVRAGSPERMGKNLELLLQTKGYTYPEYFAKFQEHLDQDPGARLTILTSFDEPQAELLLAGATASLFEKSALSPQAVLGILKSLGREDYQRALLGLGPYLVQRTGDVDAALGALKFFPTEIHPILREAVGRRGPRMRIRPAFLVEERDELALRDSLDTRYLRGFGWRVYLGFRLDPVGAEEFMAAAPADMREPMQVGYREALRQHTLAE